MAMHFHAGVDGEALSVQLKELQAAADLPVPVVVGVDAAAAEEGFGHRHDADHGEGMIFIDDIHGGDHIAGQLAAFNAHHPQGGGFGQGNGAGIGHGIGGGVAAVGGVVELAVAVQLHDDAVHIVVHAVGGEHLGGG